MTHQKAEHKIKKTAATIHPARPPALAAPARPIHESSTMIEACDRLGGKLDEIASLVREQIAAGQRSGPPEVPQPPARENAISRAVTTPVEQRVASGATPPSPPALANLPAPQVATAQTEENQEQRRETTGPLPADFTARRELPPFQKAGVRPKDQSSKGNVPGVPPAVPEGEGLAAMAQGARRLVDRLADSGAGWPEPAAGMQQALEAVMAYLENQAANVAPKFDADAIMSRLRDLEEQQQALQSQFNVSRA